MGHILGDQIWCKSMVILRDSHSANGSTVNFLGCLVAKIRFKLLSQGPLAEWGFSLKNDALCFGVGVIFHDHCDAPRPLSLRWLKWLCPLYYGVLVLSKIWSNFIATSHGSLTPNGGLVREIPLFQGNVGWWNIFPFGQKNGRPCFIKRLSWQRLSQLSLFSWPSQLPQKNWCLNGSTHWIFGGAPIIFHIISEVFFEGRFLRTPWYLDFFHPFHPMVKRFRF